MELPHKFRFFLRRFEPGTAILLNLMLGIIRCVSGRFVVDEASFISSIDCKFPYHNREAALNAIVLGCQTSTNAAFSVAHELARLPRSVSVAPPVLIELLDDLNARFEHSLKASVMKIARRMILGELLSEIEAIAAMDTIAKYPQQWCALSIAYFSCDDASGRVNEAYERIRSEWNQGANE